MLKMYAIPNCETVKKARKYLENRKVDYEFIDFKKSPPTMPMLKNWSEFLGDLPVNKKGLTYKKNKEVYDQLSDKEKVKFMISNPSIIKRPIIENGETVLAIGFDEKLYKDIFK